MKRISALIKLVQSYYNSPDPAHDWGHVGRVASTVRTLSESSGANLECVLAAAYCHDLVNLPKDHPERKEASSLSVKEALPLLKNVEFTPHEIDMIGRCIIEHSFSRGEKPSSLESAILQDADRLDALGAIGILRCASVNAQMKSRFYDPYDPLAQDRVLDDKSFMLDHYFVKLYKLPELMNTVPGRLLAEKRVEFMKTFINVLMTEIRG